MEKIELQAKISRQNLTKESRKSNIFQRIQKNHFFERFPKAMNIAGTGNW